MAPKRAFLDRSAAQKLVDPEIRHGLAIQEDRERVLALREGNILLGLVPDEDQQAQLDENIDETEKDTERLRAAKLVRKAEKDQRSVLMQQMETVLQQLNRPHTIPAVEEEREVAQATRLAFQEYLKDTDSVKSNYEKTRYPGGTVFEYQAARLEVGEKYPQEVVAEALGLEEEDMEQDSWSIDELFEILKAQRVREKAQRAREEALKIQIREKDTQIREKDARIRQQQIDLDESAGLMASAWTTLGKKRQRLSDGSSVQSPDGAPSPGLSDFSSSAGFGLGLTTGQNMTSPTFQNTSPTLQKTRSRHHSTRSSLSLASPNVQGSTGSPLQGAQSSSAQLPRANSLTARPDEMLIGSSTLDEAEWNMTAVPDRPRLIIDKCITVWDGVGVMSLNDLDDDVATKLESEVSSNLAGMTWKDFRAAMLGRVNLGAHVCVYQRTTSMKSDKAIDYSACATCVKSRKICLIKLPATNVKSYMAPLPNAPHGALPNQMAFWVAE